MKGNSPAAVSFTKAISLIPRDRRRGAVGVVFASVALALLDFVGVAALVPVLLLILSAVLFFQSGVEGVTNNWTTSFLGAAGQSEATALQALTWMLIGLTAARLVQTWLFSRVSSVSVLVVSLIATAAGFCLLAFTASPVMIYVAMTIIGAGLASTFPVILGILGSRFASLSGTAFSIALVIALCGQTTLNYTTGLISGAGAIASFPWLMVASVAAMLLLFGLYYTRLKRKSLFKNKC